MRNTAMKEGTSTNNENLCTRSKDPVEYLKEETHFGPTGQQEINQITTKGRQKWTKEEYKEIMWCHYHTILTKGISSNIQTYETWRTRNPNRRPNITANTLATQRRFIEAKHKLTEIELDNIKTEVNKEVTQKQVENEQMRTQGPNSIENDLEEPQTSNKIHVIEPTTGTRDNISITSEEEIDFTPMDIDQLRKKTDEINQTDQRKRLPKIPLNSQNIQIISKWNSTVREFLKQKEEELDLTLIATVMYAAALLATEEIGLKIQQKRKPQEPNWKIRIKKQIEKIRKDLSQLIELTKRTTETSERMLVIKEALERKYNITNDQRRTEIIETLKQKLQAKAQRLRRYTKRTETFRQNKLFKENPKIFYNEIKNTNITKQNTSLPSNEQVQQFWGAIWENERQHKENKWIERQAAETEKIEEMPWINISLKELEQALKKAADWKTPGIDGLPNFWLKKFTSCHEHLASAYNLIIKGHQSVPEWLTKGQTYLIPKNEKTHLPHNYRPITCLTTIYKNLTSILSDRLYTHLDRNNVLPPEQKGCIRDTYGCKEHLVTSNMIMADSKKKKKNVSVCWIDYQKAFDSVPHSWILRCLQIFRVNATLISFMRKIMQTWHTQLKISGQETPAGTIRVQSGIFQGDSLSPLLFCMALFPLSNELRRSQKGYKVTKDEAPINHLLYVDDLKLIAKNNEELDSLITIVKQFSEDIDMKFGIDKCARITIQRGKLKNTHDIQTNTDMEIRELEHDKFYKYLGVDEKDGVEHEGMKEKVRKEYCRRVRAILRSELTGKNKFLAIGSLAVPVLTYSFGILNWKFSEIQQLDRKTRKLLTIHKQHHPKADADRIYLSREEGGRGLIQIEKTYKVTIAGLGKYIQLKEDRYVKMQEKHHEDLPSRDSLTKRSTEIIRQTNTQEEISKIIATELKVTEKIKNMKKIWREKIDEETKSRWMEKRMHGQYPREMSKQHVDRTKTFYWLKRGRIKGETEALIVSAQDQAIATNYIKNKIMGSDISPKCRNCKTFDETVQHIISACPVLAKSEYIIRHNKVCQHLHYNILKHYGFGITDKWYEHKPESIMDNDKATIMWDIQIQTDRPVPNNKPDIVLKDKENRMCLLIDVAIPADENIILKESEKRLKYKDLEIDIQRMWKYRTEIIPIIIGSTGTIAKGQKEKLKKIPGNDKETLIYELQETAILSTAHILRKAL